MHSRISRYAEATIAFLAVVWGFLFARHLLSTLFLASDDEGYFLLAVSRYLRLGPVAAGSYAHYGPFYYFVQQAGFGILGLTVTHDTGRFLTLVCWMSAGLLGGLFVYLLSRSFLLGAAATLACIRVTSTLAQESGHPQQLVVVLFAVAACLSLSQQRRINLVLLGVVGAALVFTKINVGAFYLAALSCALICLLPASRLRSAGIAILIAYALLAAPLLARDHLESGAAGFALVASLCGAATFAQAARANSNFRLQLSQLGLPVAGGLAAAIFIVAATLLQGVPLPVLLDGIILEPARHPAGLLFLGFHLGVFPCLAAVMTLVAIGGLQRYQLRFLPSRLWLGALRAGAGLGVVFLLIRTDLSWVMALLPFGIMPITARPWNLSEWFMRLFVTALAATEFLQTYPVAGGQVGIASLPVMFWAFACLNDGIEELTGAASWPSPQMCRAGAGGLLIIVVSTGMWISGLRHLSSPYPASALRGASSLHLEPEQEKTYRFLTDSVKANCSLLYTLPRQHSLNFWSSVPPPEGSEAPLSLQLLPVERQRDIVELLQANPGACAVYNRGLLEFWQMSPRDLAQSPLVNYVLHQMQKTAEYGAYEIRAHPNRNWPWAAVPPTPLKLRGIAAH